MKLIYSGLLFIIHSFNSEFKKKYFDFNKMVF